MKDGKHVACKAFPKGVPSDIVSGKKAHTKKLEGQKGNYVYAE